MKINLKNNSIEYAMKYFGMIHKIHVMVINLNLMLEMKVEFKMDRKVLLRLFPFNIQKIFLRIIN